MSSTFTTNKGIEQPSTGDYVNAWAGPVNQDWAIVDRALGGTQTFDVTSVSGATPIALTLTQYQPPNIEFTGTLSDNLNYQIPAGVGGVWSISRATTGNFSLSFSIAAGNSLTLGSGRTMIVSDGANVSIADSATAAATLLAAQQSAAALYAPYTTGSFVGVLTSGSTAPISCSYRIAGGICCLIIGYGGVPISGASLFMSGLPSAIVPTTNSQPIPLALATNNGTPIDTCIAYLPANNSTMQFYANAASFSSGGWTGSAEIGRHIGFGNYTNTIVYAL